jgi:hypothetical protein
MPLWLKVIAAVGISWLAYYVIVAIGFVVREAFDIAVMLWLLLTIPAFRQAIVAGAWRAIPRPGDDRE